MRRRIHVDYHDTAEGAASTPAEQAAGAQAPAVAEQPVPESAGAPGVDAPPPAPVMEQELQALRDRVADLEKQVELERKNAEEARNQNLRTLADFQNFRRRSEEQRGELGQFANRELVLGLLPILDNFERALAAAEKSQSYEALVGGVGLTLRQLQEFLKKNGVEPIEAVGKEFDPYFHEAVMRVEDSGQPENTVVDELQRGYTMHSRVLRPSMVRVAQS